MVKQQACEGILLYSVRLRFPKLDATVKSRQIGVEMTPFVFRIQLGVVLEKLKNERFFLCIKNTGSFQA